MYLYVSMVGYERAKASKSVSGKDAGRSERLDEHSSKGCRKVIKQRNSEGSY